MGKSSTTGSARRFVFSSFSIIVFARPSAIVHLNLHQLSRFSLAEAPEEEHDNRSLFERLEEQRQKKELDFEETHRLSTSCSHSESIYDKETDFMSIRFRKYDQRIGRR